MIYTLIGLLVLLLILWAIFQVTWLGGLSGLVLLILILWLLFGR